MRIDVVSLFPEFVLTAVGFGITGRTVERGLLQVAAWNPRDYTCDPHRTVDDRPYGGGPGMVMKIEPLRAAIRAARAALELPARTIYLSPRGRRLEQGLLQSASTEARLILLAGRYEGIDERLIELEVDEEWSIGDYVLSGGELPAMVVIDAIARLLPGALGDEQSAVQDSFVASRLDHAHYTRPEVYEGRAVPKVLLGGNHETIRRYRLRESLAVTLARRPDLLDERNLSQEERLLLDELKAQNSVATGLQTR